MASSCNTQHRTGMCSEIPEEEEEEEEEEEDKGLQTHLVPNGWR